MHIRPRTQRNTARTGGFSLIELLVVIALLVIVTALSLAGYNSFSDNSVAANLADDIGLSIRLAQSYGVNVERHGTTFSTSYGIHFEKGKQKTYLLYADPNRSADLYRYTSATEIVRKYQISSGYLITDVCATLAGGATTKCFSDGSITSLDIAFDRPNPDAHFTSSLIADTYQSATISIHSPRGVTKKIRVLPTGYISVQ